jgi:cytochrome c peroxidase
LSAEELEGYSLFRSFGCVSCHQGRNVGGNLFQKLGLVRPYYQGEQQAPSALGRFNVTGDEGDRHVFKVPSLRNVALTAPYFHDGSVATLEEAIVIMGYHQLGRSLGADEVQAIGAFLKTLTGELL